jgi:translocation and assembly module TamB
LTRIIAAIVLLFIALPALAQDSAEQEKSWFVQFVEHQLSTPNRKISISDIEGVLSSKATIRQITVADHQGVWLKITNASIDWTRAALLLGRLDINKLGADSIEMLRKPLPAENALPSPESSSFQLPEFPVSVELKSLSIAKVIFAESVFGLHSELNVAGNLSLAGGSLDTALDIHRLDGPGGEFKLAAKYANATKVLDLDADLSEPQNGIIANLLNIDGRPPVKMTVKGSGPLDRLDVGLTLDVAQQRVLTGTTNLRRRDRGLGFSAKLEGPIARLVPITFRSFFGANTSLAADGLVHDAGGFDLSSIKLSSAALTLDGSASTTKDNFLRRLKLDATIADPGGKKVILPVPGGSTTVDNASLALDFGDDASGKWTGSLKIGDLTTTTFSAKTVALGLGGMAQNLDQPSSRRITFQTSGKASGITAKREDVSKALGKEIDLAINGDWSAGQPVNLSEAKLSGNGLGLSLTGKIADYAFNGKIDIDATSIAPLSDMSGHNLSGSMKLGATGSIKPLSGAFDLTLDGHAHDLAVGTSIDNLLTGDTRLSGRVARDAKGFRADSFRIGNDRVSITADGTFATGAADFNFDVALSDLALISNKASGRLTASGSAKGTNGHINLTFGAKVPDGTLTGKSLKDGALDFAGLYQNNTLGGKLTGGASLGGTPVTLQSGINVANDEKHLRNLDFAAGATHLTGNITETKQGLFDGKLSLASTDISTAAALVLAEASGSANADITLSVANEKQNAAITAEAKNLTVNKNRIGSADIKAKIADLFGVPAIDGEVKASDLFVGGIDVDTLDAHAATSGKATNFSANAALKNGTKANLAGALAPQNGGYRLSLARVNLTQGKLSASLVQPASILVDGQNFTIDDLAFDVGGGRIEASGKVAETLDLSVAIKALPLDIANVVRPDLALGGTLDGTARIGGDRTKPDIHFALQGRSITAAALKQAGLRSIGAEAKGSSNGDRLDLDASITSPEGLRLTTNGSVPLGKGDIALDVELKAFPLAVLNGVVKGKSIGGSLSGSAHVAGTRANPTANFKINGTRVSAAPLSGAGVSSLEIAAAGRYVNKAITLSSATARSPQGLTLAINGHVPLSGAGLDLEISGKAPLSLANRLLADRGGQASGTVSFSAKVTGSMAKPRISGSISTSGAQLIDPQSNVRLNAIALSASVEGETVTIRSASASIAGGGTVHISGTVSTNAAGGFPANIKIVLDKARYADGKMVVATLSGQLTVTGGLTRDPLISGNIDIARADITVPDSFAGAASTLNVKHIHPPRRVAETLKRARANDGTPMPTARPSIVRVDITVRAPNRIFVRGRGLDTELGGRVKLTGPITDLHPVGGFKLIRGRLNILTQRITINEGQVSLIGDLNPFINFVAQTEGENLTVFVTVSGRVDDPKIVFSSQPELPQDEVLAQLIFKRSISELSPIQIAQLAAAVAELAGGSNTSLLDNLRKATGLDDLDVVTDQEGKTAVRAGRYISEHVYLGVEAGTEGNTKATVNLDITKHLKAKGGLGTQGDSDLGLFYEKDY